MKLDGINELIAQRAKFLIESEKLLEDPTRLLCERVRYLTWAITALTVTQVGLRFILPPPPPPPPFIASEIFFR